MDQNATKIPAVVNTDRLTFIETFVRYAYGLEIDQIKGRMQSKGVVRARKALCWLMRTELQWSFKEIGNHIGGRDHTTIMSAVNTFDVNDHPEMRKWKSYKLEM